MNESQLQARFLEARDDRQRELQRALAEAGARGAASVVMASANVPGAVKDRPGLAGMVHGALDGLEDAIGLKVTLSRVDALGPFHLGHARVAPQDAKQAALALEEATLAGRLLDLDVYRLDGSQLDRAELGLTPRPCLVCGEPARDCMLLRRHAQGDLVMRVDALLAAVGPHPARLEPQRLAAQLHLGALRELDLTPKPGLVDRHDPGSHADLSYDVMRASADLLPLYYEELLACLEAQAPLEACVQAGVAAERRMYAGIQTNAHKGYIFLSGLVLMAAVAGRGRLSSLPCNVAETARRFFATHPPAATHGAAIRARSGLGGIRAEAEAGLPAVFEQGWPKYRQALAAGWAPERAAFYLMAVLMQHVEDTTAIQRCGPEGLACLKRDGARLQGRMEDGQDPRPLLASLNDDYRRLRLTMGGVADCLALTFALESGATSL
jgi:triphosphoribosyl-dephospho-CoA synthase